jgi:tRNA pseudouridine55 synthase
MNGIINILKPPGMTSFDVVGYLRGLIKIKKIGHTGTLDPAAVGVLPICIGNGTKVIEFLTNKDKLYRAELTLGITTDTQDSTGNIIKKSEVNVSEKEIYDIFSQFVGKYEQLPPMFSAVKIEGKRLYELARSGITIEREPRQVEIYSLDIMNIVQTPNIKILFDVVCSKGTYIRTLCEDMGKELGCGGNMSFLVRIRAGTFNIENSVSLEEIKELSEKNILHQKLIGIDQVFPDLKKIILDNEKIKKLINGLSIIHGCDDFYQEELIRVYNEEEEFISIAVINKEAGKTLIKSKKLFL